MKRLSGSRRRMALLVVAFAVSAAILGMLMLQKYQHSRMKTAPPPKAEETGSILVTLFFAAPDGSGLVREARQLDACENSAECAEAVVDELINGPVSDNSPTLPPTAALNSVSVQQGTAIVDFGRLFTEDSPPGSHGEMMAIYSVIDSLAFNFPYIKQVKFLMAGKSVPSLGHLDLSTPLPPDFTLEKK